MAPRRAQYRIQTVANKTGVPAATLRSWERRYGVPQPNRTSSSYRLYSDHDVAQVKRMRAMCESGLSASEAARIVREEPTSEAEHADPFARASERLVEAAISFDASALHDRLRWALTLGDAVTVYERVIAPSLRRVGDLWEAGRVSIGQEHLFSDTVEYALRDLLRLVQPADAEACAVLACFPEEHHTLGLFGVGVRLSTLGVRTVMLGARTPPPAVHHAVERVRPAFVGLSATAPLEGDPERLLRTYADAVGDTPWLVGGAQAESLRPWVEAAGGRVISPWPDGVHAVVREILRTSSSNDRATTPATEPAGGR